jgi:membrane protease YdiL (CAAX protease family)
MTDTTTLAPVEPVRAVAPRPARWRWAVHLALLAAFPAFTALTAAGREAGAEPGLSTTTIGLLRSTGVNLAIFVAIFGAACLFSRPRRDQLLLAWRGGFRPIAFGFLWSLALRGLVAMLAFAVVLLAGLLGGRGATEALQPKVESLVDWRALQDPAYFALALTLVSFVLAGLREELWRAGMIAGVRALLPERLRGVRGDALAIAGSAVLFGIGHLSQGWVAVGATTVLGLALGALMVWRRSIWEPVFAHGFFDAASIAALRFVGPMLERLKG